MQYVYEFLKNAGTYYLATLDGNQPRVRTFGTINIYNGKLYIETEKKKAVSRQISKNPNVEICAFHNGKWFRVACELAEDNDISARISMLEAYPQLRQMCSENDGNMQVFSIRNATATFSSFTSSPETVKF